MTARRHDLEPQMRGDAVYINIDNVVDRNGASVSLSNYSIRCVVKPAASTTTDDSDALATLTSGSGITVSGNDAEILIPPSASSAVTSTTRVKYDVQVTSNSNSNDVRTILFGTFDYVTDVTRTSP